MSRRPSGNESGFGSDSLLDVLSNVVGILIILVVIAGARVARAPLSRFITGLPEEPAAAEPAPPQEVAHVAAPLPAPPEPALEPVLEPELTEPPAELTREIQSLAVASARYESQASEAAGNLDTILTEYNALRNALSEQDQKLSAEQQEIKKYETALARIQESLGERQQTLSGLLAEFEQVKDARPPVVEVRHRLTPIGQAIANEEIHFRLSNNRVSAIPLAQLIERVKAQLERQKAMLARHPHQQGRVGPVDGYSLHYLVEREALSPLEENRLPIGTFRVSVSTWQLVPEADVEAETAEQALRRGSRFVAALRAAPEKAALTFWVYPDSFALFRALQAAAHAEGFVVSARPLPDGVPIAGSPHGSRSLGQ
jgi:hypothetical protein